MPISDNNSNMFIVFFEIYIEFGFLFYFTNSNWTLVQRNKYYNAFFQRIKLEDVDDFYIASIENMEQDMK